MKTTKVVAVILAACWKLVAAEGAQVQPVEGHVEEQSSIERPDFYAPEEDLERMEGSDYPEIAARARSLLNASRERLTYWDFSEEQIEALAETRKLRRTLAVVSPVTGLVVDKMDQAPRLRHTHWWCR